MSVQGFSVHGLCLSCSIANTVSPFSSIVVHFLLLWYPTEIVNASSTVDSPAAGIATSPPPKVMVVSALDPDVIVDVRFDVKLLV